MKKTLLAAALTIGFVGAAQAETSVTLYGIVDAGISYQQVKGTVDGSMVQGGTPGTPFDYKSTGGRFLSGGQSESRWGLRGTEDLGSGLQAVFVLESGFELGTGTTNYNNRLFGRQATVGLRSDAWGQLDFGRQSNIATKYFADIASPFGVDFSQARVGATFGAADSVRLDNMIMYQTPSYSGFQLGVGYSFNSSGNQQFRTSGDNQPNSRGWTAGLRYANGPIGVAATYDLIKSAETFGPVAPEDNGVSIKSWNLGASYDFNVVKLHLGFGQTRNGWLQSVQYANLPAIQTLNTGYFINDGMKVNSYTVGLSAPIGSNSSVMASWGMADPRDAGIHGTATSKQQIYSLGYTYALSKRTNVYAIGSYAKHVAFQDDLKSTFVGAGIRHQF